MLAHVFTAVIVALPFFASSAVAGPCVRKYTVKPGDVCDAISNSQHVSTYQLAVINTGYVDSSCSNLKAGDEICIGYENEDCSTTHTVVGGDTCSQVQETYGLNHTILYANNPQINEECDNIYVGEVLCVSKDVQVPPAPGKIPSVTPPSAVPAKDAPKPSTSSTTPAESTPTAPAAPTPTATTPASDASLTGDDDENDDDLPFCDEL